MFQKDKNRISKALAIAGRRCIRGLGENFVAMEVIEAAPGKQYRWLANYISGNSVGMFKLFYKWSWLLVIDISLLLYSNSAFAFLYGEHKIIGDRAFARFMSTLKNSNDATPLCAYLENLTINKTPGYVFPNWSVAGGNDVSYGVLNGLAGDQQGDPLALEEQMKTLGSPIQRIIALHQLYLDKGFKAAPDFELEKIDINYGLMAAVTLSHFYEYGKTFQGQFKNFDRGKLSQATDRAFLSAFVASLKHSNALEMYVCLHLLAVNMAENSGHRAATGDTSAIELMQGALMLNGFADHFLEDSFSSGHLVIKRTVLGAFPYDKMLHDFYNKNGTDVVNRKGEVWRAYGDGMFDANSTNGERIVSAVQSSLQELCTAFNESYKNKDYIRFLDRIPDSKEAQALYLIKNVAPLSCVPIPYNSDLGSLMISSDDPTIEMKKANHLVYYRNLIAKMGGIVTCSVLAIVLMR